MNTSDQTNKVNQAVANGDFSQVSDADLIAAGHHPFGKLEVAITLPDGTHYPLEVGLNPEQLEAIKAGDLREFTHAGNLFAATLRNHDKQVA